MHVILGANGVIGRELSLALASASVALRQVSRNPVRVNASDELVVADLTDSEATRRAIAGSEVAYLVAGLKYDTAVWQEQWPRVMQNAIDG
jgi:nucleoside-diphosphate-sugar epimerase